MTDLTPLIRHRLEQIGIGLDSIPWRHTPDGAPFVDLEDLEQFIDAAAELLHDDPGIIVALMHASEPEATH